MGQRGHGAGWRVGIALVWLVGWLLVAVEPSAAQTVPVPNGAVRGGGGNTLGAVRLRDGREAAAGRVIVRFRDNTPQGEQDDAHRVVGGRVVARTTPRTIQQVTTGGAQVVEVAGASVEDATDAYRADARVLYAQPDYVRYALETPYDPSVGSQYGLTKINAPAAWNVTHGSSTVKIAVLDCGIHETHPDLVEKVVLRQDFTGSAYGTDDRCNHGTHVAGIASAVTNNGVGVAGVGYNTSLMNGKVLLDSGFGSDSVIGNGIIWAADNGANVINMSIGGGPSCAASPFMRDAVNYAASRNVVVVAAAGNEASTVGSAPGDCDNVVSVASTDSNDAKSSFSNYGAWVKVAAPGSSILSSVNPDVSGGALYGNKSGTSMATPHVAGVAALLWATSYGSSAQSVINRMYATAEAIPGTGSYWQYGRVNVGEAVAGGGRLPAPTLASLSPTRVTGGSAAFTLTVDGTNFNNGATVRWNDVARDTTYVSTTRLTATITAADIATASPVSITVANPDEQVSGRLSFTVVPPPAITGVAPSSGLTTGGRPVTLTGQNFRSGVTVTIGGASCAVAAMSTTAITCTVPPGAAGSADIAVTNTDGTSVTQVAGYFYVLREVVPAPGGGGPNPAFPARATPAAFVPNAQPNAAPARRA